MLVSGPIEIAAMSFGHRIAVDYTGCYDFCE